MKLLIVAPHFPPSALPPSIRVRMYCKYFKQFGIEPHVLTLGVEQTEDVKDEFMLKGLACYERFVKKFQLRKKYFLFRL